MLRGTITGAMPGGRQYTFRGTAGDSITVEIKPNVWRGLTVAPSDTVMIGGELKTNRGQQSIAVRVILGDARVSRAGQAIAVGEPITVREAKSLPHDSWVVIRGTIVNAMPGGKIYTFEGSADATGTGAIGGVGMQGGDNAAATGENTILVEIERKIWRGLTVGVNDRVEISGEVKASQGQTLIKVRSIRRQ